MEFLNLSTRSKKITALILALLLYLLILALLFLDIAPILHLDSLNPFKEKPSVPFMPQVARRNPAPVRYMNQPTQAAPKVAPTTPQPMQTPAPASPPQPKPEKIESPKALPKDKERAIKTPPTLGETPFISPTKAPDPENLLEEQEKENYERMRKQRSRSKWYKEGAEPQTQAQQPHNYHPSQMAQLADGFYEHMQKQYDQTLPNGVHGSDNGSVDPQAIEYGMFIYRFNHQFCNESHMRPMSLHSKLIQPHTMQLSVTINRSRKVTDVKFIKPSYNEQINDYVRDLLYATITPQFPSFYKEDIAILPINIRLDRIYNQDKVWFYPID